MAFVASDIGFINSFAGSVELSIAVPNIFAEDPLHGQNAFAEIGGYELIGVYVTANSAI